MQIAFTGSVCVGKSTLVKEVSKLFLDHVAIVEVPYLVPGVRGTYEWTRDFQNKLEEVYKLKNVICDRYFVDRLAWELLNPLDRPYHEALCTQARHAIFNTIDNVHLFYVPIEFPYLEREGRDDNALVQKVREVYDATIKDLLYAFELPHTVLHGTVEERVAQIRSKLPEVIH